MKKAVVLFLAVMFTAFLGGCSAGETQNNISRAIDGAAGVIDDGIDKFENGTYNDITKNSRGWENGTYTNGSNEPYYSDMYTADEMNNIAGLSNNGYTLNPGINGTYGTGYVNR